MGLATAITQYWLDRFDPNWILLTQTTRWCHHTDNKKDIWWIVISNNGPVNYRLPSCDLRSLHFFLWINIKLFMYSNKPVTLHDFQANVKHVIAGIRPKWKNNAELALTDSFLSALTWKKFELCSINNGINCIPYPAKCDLKFLKISAFYVTNKMRRC